MQLPVQLPTEPLMHSCKPLCGASWGHSRIDLEWCYMAWQMWALLLASSSSLGRPIGAPRVFFLTRNTCFFYSKYLLVAAAMAKSNWIHFVTHQSNIVSWWNMWIQEFSTAHKEVQSTFSMTSFRCHEVQESGCNPSFEIEGQVCHRMGSLCPLPNEEPMFTQV